MNKENFVKKILSDEYEFVNDFDSTYILDEINITINENETFDIYVRIYFSVYEYEEHDGESDVKTTNAEYLKKTLERFLYIVPDEWVETIMGAPFDDCCIGYHDLPFDFIYVDSFILAWNIWNSNRDEGARYNWEEDDIDNNIAMNMLDILNKDLRWKGYVKSDNIYISSNGKVIIGTANSLQMHNIAENIRKIKTSDVYYGTYISGIIEEGKSIIWSRRLENEVLEMFESVNTNAEIEYYADTEYIYLVCQKIAAKMKRESDDLLKMKELGYVRKGVQGYNSLFPRENVLKITFDKIVPDEFEIFCNVLLLEMDFYDSHLMGTTKSSDGGVDIVAYKDVESMGEKKEKQKWIIQCKHYKKGSPITRAGITEIPYLLTENNAQKYLLLSTKQLSSQVCKRIDSINECNANIIEYFSGADLKILVGGYPDIVDQFKLRLE